MLGRFYKTSIGKKVVVALSGLFLITFVFGHMLGNLKFFGGIGEDGQHKLDHYAHTLRIIGADFIGENTFLWAFRIALLVALVLHVVSVILLNAQNNLARGTSYKAQNYLSSTIASRYMMVGGFVLLTFIVFHILHFTTGDLHFYGFEHGSVYNNVVSGFSVKWVAAFYIAAMLALALHVYHGAWSVFQTLGLDNPNWNSKIRSFALALAVILFIGFSSVPLLIVLGFYTTF